MKNDEVTPFDDKFGDSIGRGKDNVVVPLTLRDDIVVKWNHDSKEPLTIDDHFKRTLYKKRKYEMLNFFLPEFIPESYFLLGNKNDNSHIKIKEYTIQNKVPQVTIAALTEEQKQDPRLLTNIHTMIFKLQNMYRLIQQVNNLVDDNGKLDAKLDLGGLSKYADEHQEDDINNFDWDIINYDFMSSPNLLVDPETMDIYCIDFDQGVWNAEKEATYTMLISMAKQNQKVMEVIEK